MFYSASALLARRTTLLIMYVFETLVVLVI